MTNKLKEKKVGFLETRASDGMLEKSSKRLVGVISFLIGGIFLIGLGMISFSSAAADPNTIMTVGTTFIIAGSSLLGIGVLEGIGNKQ